MAAGSSPGSYAEASFTDAVVDPIPPYAGPRRLAAVPSFVHGLLHLSCPAFSLDISVHLVISVSLHARLRLYDCAGPSLHVFCSASPLLLLFPFSVSVSLPLFFCLAASYLPLRWIGYAMLGLSQRLQYQSCLRVALCVVPWPWGGSHGCAGGWERVPMPARHVCGAKIGWLGWRRRCQMVVRQWGWGRGRSRRRSVRD